MNQDSLHTTLGCTNRSVHRLGLTASYRPGRQTIYRAIDRGVNYFFAYGFDLQMMAVMRDVFRTDREKHILDSGAYDLLFGHTTPRRALEKRLRQQ